MRLYRVTNWDEHYEVADSRKIAGPLKWVAVKTGTDGLGFGRLTLEKDKCELLAAWYLILGQAAKQSRDERGTLARDGVPMTADDLELVTRFPAKIFERAFEFFSNPRIGWLTVDDQVSPEISAACPVSSAESGSVHGASPNTGQDMTGHNRTGHDMTVGVSARPKAPAAKTTDGEWLEGLKRNPAYEGIDVERERAKCEIWCANKRVVMSRGRLINWLNRAERPIGGGPRGVMR